MSSSRKPLSMAEPSSLSEPPSRGQLPPEGEPLALSRGWIAVGIAAIALGIAMGLIMSSVWLPR